MRLFRTIIGLLLLIPAWMLSAQQSERKIVDFSAESGTPIHIGDSTALKLRGNVIFYHNGAVLTCDSAIRYNNMHMDCFGQVVINQNTTYVYGDRVEYNGELNMARVYAPIIKIVDGDATMYTRNFTFNTFDKIGHYFGGGTMQQQENLLESEEGYYYVDKRELVAVDDVEMRNLDYQMQSDSVTYNMDSEVASFYTKTHIWTSNDEILSATQGEYDNLSGIYRFWRDAYLYDGDKELWADSLVYNSIEENVWMYNNIQMLDNVQSAMGFGDYGQYWGDQQNGLLTRNPSLVSIDREQSDTLFLSADSIFLYTFDSDLVLNVPQQAEQTVVEGEELITPTSGRTLPADSLAQQHEHAREMLDSLTHANTPPPVPLEDETVMLEDSLQVRDQGDTLVNETEVIAEGDSLEVQEPVELTREERRRLRDEEKRIAKEAKEEARRQKQAERDAELLAKRMKRLKDREAGEDITVNQIYDTLGVVNDGALRVDSADIAITDVAVGLPVTDSLATDSLTLVSEAQPQVEEDSLQRVFMAYYNVKIYRGDVQAVCDSLIGFSADSTLHMYIEPILWNGNNQLTAEIIDIFMKDGELDRAFFSGEPLMVAEVEPENKYNQIKGKTMQSLFRNNDIYRHDVDANARTLYYMQDEETGDYMGLINVESADVSFYIDSMQMRDIVWRGSPVYVLYPMDKISEKVELQLPGFGWYADRKPTRHEVFDRTIRPSEKNMYDTVSRPQFPITQRLLKNRDDMIEYGRWVERNDRLTAPTIEWIRSIDPNYGRDPEDEINRGGTNTIELPSNMTDSLSVGNTQVPPKTDTLPTSPAINTPNREDSVKDIPNREDSVKNTPEL